MIKIIAGIMESAPQSPLVCYNCGKEMSCLNFVRPDLYQASFMISNFAEEEFSEEDDNVSDVEVA